MLDKNHTPSEITRLECVVCEDRLDLVTGIFFQHVSFGWEEEVLPSGETLFRAYCLEPVFVEKISQILQETLPDIVIKKTSAPNQDWMFAWREFFTPVHAGVFTVIPPWLEGKVSTREHSIIIEPKTAFGTGHHETTALCLEAISESVCENSRLKRFFDIGAGSGILSVACAKLGLTGVGVDIDPIAIANALENIVLNGVGDFVSIEEGSVEAGADRQFDLIVANILAEPLKTLSGRILSRLVPGGRLILSGILSPQAASVETMYASLGAPQRYASGEWVALVWRSPLA